MAGSSTGGGAGAVEVGEAGAAAPFQMPGPEPQMEFDGRVVHGAAPQAAAAAAALRSRARAAVEKVRDGAGCDAVVLGGPRRRAGGGRKACGVCGFMVGRGGGREGGDGG